MLRSGRLLVGVLVLFLAACSELTEAPPAELTGPEGGTLTAQAVDGGVFFSEYIEGTSNNKALEIYNATAAAIDLAAGGYKVEMYFNGSSTAGLTVNLTGTLAAGDVFVLAHSSASAVILAQADLTNGAGFFNGDDAVVLRRGTTILDVIGQIGVDPGTQWGAGLASTADNTLRLKAQYCTGDPTGDDAFDPAAEYDGYATDDFTGLGSHTLGEACEPRAGGGDGGDEEPTIGLCGDPATLIHDVQGPGAQSPLAGTKVVIEGVVVGDFQRGDGDAFDLSGYFVQEEDDDADADPLTSEGLFVFYSTGLNVNVGEQVRVLGTVVEFNGLTELSGVEAVVSCGPGVMPTATQVTLPVASLGAFEALEGMLVTVPQGLLISEYFNYGRFGEVVLAAAGDDPVRPFQPTAIMDYDDPDVAAALALHQLSRITLDDGLSSQNPNVVRHPNGDPFTLDDRFRGGDVVTNLTGIVDFSFGIYRVQPTQDADFTVANPRPETPDVVDGSVRVAAFNVLNYFDTIDLGPDICGPAGNEECRGADTALEFTRQRDKIINALLAMDAHVVGLIEIENDLGQGALIDLVDGLNAASAPGRYAYVDTFDGVDPATTLVGPDVIKVALIYQPAAVTPVGGPAVLDSLEFLDPNDTGEDRNRAALAQTFDDLNGGRFTAVVNHFKSKGSSCEVFGDDDPIQGSCNQTRILAAQRLLEWLDTDPTGSGDPDFLLVGDFNSYDREEPIFELRSATDGVFGTADDLTDLLREYGGEYAYTYVFDGLLGYLDYAFSTATLTPQVTGATAWHINADEPSLIDYDMSFKPAGQDALYAPDPFRSSDHDPVIVGLDLNAGPSCEAATASLARLWPADHALKAGQLTVGDPENDPVTITIDAIFQDEPVDGDNDGATAPDAFIHADGAFQLRAERDGEGNGRVYHVSFTASDPTGSCSGVMTFGAPISQGRGGQAVDDGPLYDSTLTN